MGNWVGQFARDYSQEAQLRSEPRLLLPLRPFIWMTMRAESVDWYKPHFGKEPLPVQIFLSSSYLFGGPKFYLDVYSCLNIADTVAGIQTYCLLRLTRIPMVYIRNHSIGSVELKDNASGGTVKSVLSRRDFGKSVSAGALGSLAASSVPSLAQAQGKPAQVPKRMTTVLREMIDGPGVIAAPGIYDVITARTAEKVGFRALDLPGSALGYATCMMEPNLTLTDMVDATRSITGAVNIPVVVDVGAGFGEPAHVVHMVHLLEQAGAAGIHLEDQIYPKRFHYHTGQEHTIELEPWLDKIRYALQARSDSDFIVVARTDAFKTVSFAEGIRRSNLALEAGAQMIMPSHVESMEQLKQLPKEINGPMNWTHGFGLSLKQLEDMSTSKGRYKLVNYVGGPIQWSYKAVRDGLMNLKQTGEIGMDPVVWAPITKEIQELAGLPGQITIENATTEKGSS